MKRALWCGFFVLVLLLAACEDEANAPRRPTPYTPPAAIPWERPSTAITAQNAPQLKLIGILSGHTDTIFESAISPNSQRLATIGGDNRLVVWNIASGRSLMSVGEILFSHAFFLADDNMLLTINGGQDIQKWSVLDNEQVASVTGSTERITAAALSPDASQLLVGDLFGEVRVFETATLTETRKFAAQEAGNPVRSIFYSTNGERLYTLGQEGIAYQWNTTTWERLGTIEEQLGPALYSVLSPDRSRLAIARPATVSIFDTNAGTLLTSFTTPPFQGIQQMEFSADNAWLAIGGDIDSVVIFDITTGDLVVALREHGRNFKSLAFAPDRSVIATGLDGGQAYLWDLSSLVNAPPNTSQVEIQIPRAILTQAKDIQLSQLRWSPDGTYMMLGDRRGTVYILGIP